MAAHAIDGRPVAAVAAPALSTASSRGASRSSDGASSSSHAPNGGGSDGGDPSSVIVNLLARSLDRQVLAAERTADRMDDLGGRIDRMGDRIAEEVRAGMSLQLRVVGGLVALAIILLAAVAGVQFSGSLDRDGSVKVETVPSTTTGGASSSPEKP